MKRYVALMAGIAGIFLLAYVAVQAFRVPVLHDPAPVMETAGLAAALVGLTLLAADVLIPVPSSLVMVAHGAIFGMAAGALLSLLGRAGSFLVGYLVGRRFSAAAARLIGHEELDRANDRLRTWGLPAIAATRPMPLVSETVSIAAGISRLPLARGLLAAVAGSVPEAVLFGAAGAAGATFLGTSWIFLGVIAATALTWGLGNRRQRAQPAPEGPTAPIQAGVR